MLLHDLGNTIKSIGYLFFNKTCYQDGVANPECIHFYILHNCIWNRLSFMVYGKMFVAFENFLEIPSLQ